MLQVRDLLVSVAGKNLLSNINLELHEGESLAIMGESGAGKTLLALSLMGLFPHKASVSGEIDIFGKNILRLGKHELAAIRGRQIALIFQEPLTALNPLMPVYKQIAEPLLIHKLSRPKAAKEQAISYLGEMGIDDYEKKAFFFPHQLSGGERQRVLIAQALIAEPRILIADEPTASLDPISKLQIVNLIDNMSKRIGATLLVVTHELAVAKLLCKKAAILYNGNLLEVRSLDRSLDPSENEYIRSLFTNNLL